MKVTSEEVGVTFSCYEQINVIETEASVLLVSSMGK